MPRSRLVQALQMLLWPEEPAPSSAAPPPPTPTQAPKPEAAPPIASVLAPATFRHPRANRETRLDSHHVGYEFRRGKRKSIGFVVSTDGLVVSAPRWVAVAEVEAALQEKSRWILDKLREQDERARRMASQRIEWRDGTTIPFLGESVIVVLDPRSASAVLHTAEDTLPGVPRLTLHVGLPQTAAPEQIRDAVQSWLQRQARRVFEERCTRFAAELGVRFTRLSLSSATTRWGSASADGAIRLHWRLIHFALPTIDYVVAHELAHLRVMDHSPRFWDVVRSVIPEMERVRSTLRDEALPHFE
ncbi:MAG TPA: SprT family zinc-dependent metalloprotease [Burkholderiaceae bacterium]|nr:SprT family zinc-dependent metalloprotease [Burkholderiaceae bacterium]